MSDSLQSSATPATPVRSTGAVQFFAPVGRSARRLLVAFLSWPGGRWPVPTVVSLGLMALAAVVVVELLPRDLVGDVTLTVNARTEVLEVTLEPDRPYVWWLPPGSYSLLNAPVNANCARGGFDVVCTYEQPTALAIDEGATVRLEVQGSASAPRFTLALAPLERGGAAAKEDAASFEVLDRGKGPLVSTEQPLTFQSIPTRQWRIPLVVERVTIGESLSDTVVPDESLDTVARQPILTEGDVQIFARAWGFKERYLVKDERFDPADFVQIPADAKEKGLLLGLLALDAGADDAPPQFEVTLHSDFAEAFVRRLGAQHVIAASTWAIMSKLPFFAAWFVVWFSLVTFANFYSARLGGLRGRKNEAQQPPRRPWRRNLIPRR